MVHSGNVNIITLNEAEIMPAGYLRIFFSLSLAKKDNIISFMRAENRIIPSTAEKDSCRLILPAAKGLERSSIESANEMDVSGSFSRLKKGAIKSTVCMIPALAAEGVFPVIKTKSHIRHKEVNAPLLLLPKRVRQNPATNEICIPV